jgi:ribose/xylose/arabinose/galactoside ABC-type transport system permease subunit
MLNPKKIRTILFVNSGAIAAIAGLIHTSQTRGANAMGGLIMTMPHMSAFIASILGGVSFFGGSGSLAGAFMGVILIELLRYSLIVMGLPLPIANLLNGSLLILAFTIDRIAISRRMKKLGLQVGGGGGGPVMPGVSQR